MSSGCLHIFASGRRASKERFSAAYRQYSRSDGPEQIEWAGFISNFLRCTRSPACCTSTTVLRRARCCGTAHTSRSRSSTAGAAGLLFRQARVERSVEIGNRACLVNVHDVKSTTVRLVCSAHACSATCRAIFAVLDTVCKWACRFYTRDCS